VPRAGMTAAPIAEDFSAVGGWIPRTRWRRYWKLLRLLDAAADARRWWALRGVRRDLAAAPPANVLLAAIRVPGREAALDRVLAALAATTRHRVTLAVAEMAPVGKFANINRALAGHDPAGYDWLLIADDDIAVPDGFLDLLLYFAARCDFKLAQPAHRFLSFASFAVTERHWGALVRRSGFVEIGPVTLLHRDTFADLLPFPELRWAWGLDIWWADLARRRGWALGVVDAVPIRHLRPIGTAYDTDAARAEAQAFLARQGVAIGRAELFGIDRRLA